MINTILNNREKRSQKKARKQRFFRAIIHAQNCLLPRVLFTHNDHEQNIPLIKRDIVGQVPSGSRVTRLRYAYLSPFVHRKDWMSTVWWRGCARIAKDSEVGGGSWGQMFHSIENYRGIFLLLLHPLHIVHAPFIIRSQTKFLLPLPFFLSSFLTLLLFFPFLSFEFRQSRSRFRSSLQFLSRNSLGKFFCELGHSYGTRKYLCCILNNFL